MLWSQLKLVSGQIELAMKQMVLKLEEWRHVQERLDSDIKLFESEHSQWFSSRSNRLPDARTMSDNFHEWVQLNKLVHSDLLLFRSEHKLWADSCGQLVSGKYTRVVELTSYAVAGFESIQTFR